MENFEKDRLDDIVIVGNLSNSKVETPVITMVKDCYSMEMEKEVSLFYMIRDYILLVMLRNSKSFDWGLLPGKE